MIGDYALGTSKVQIVRIEKGVYTSDGYMVKTIHERIDGELNEVLPTP